LRPQNLRLDTTDGAKAPPGGMLNAETEARVD